MISITLNNGKTWIPCPDGVRVTIENQLIDGEDREGDVVFNFTSEGLITDIWVPTESVCDSNLGTSSEMYSDIISRLVEDNS